MANLRYEGSRFEDLLAVQIRAHGLPEPTRQYRFAQELEREYRVDFAWPERRLVVEVDGGRFVGRGGSGRGRPARAIPVAQHQSDSDYRKRNLLQMLGWTVLAYPTDHVTSGEAINEITLALERQPLPRLAKDSLWEARLRTHCAATLERDRKDRANAAQKAKKRDRLRNFKAQFAQEQAERAAARTARTSTGPDSRSTPATAPPDAASPTRRDE